jgi:SNF2 family DNA or RNA helicase
MSLKFHPKDIEAAEKIVSSSGVKNVVFSHHTYQVEVDDLESKESTWVFIQLDEKSAIQDCFCTCKKAEYTQSCPHLAAGALAILSAHKKPLHLRYEKSLVSKLFFILARRHGFEQTVLQKEDDFNFYIPLLDKKKSFVIHLKNGLAKEKLEELFDKPSETEENSIKFSNLNPEELKNYREGKPSIQLQFELSFWSDFSKWVFFRAQNPEDLDVKVVENDEQVPTHLIIESKDLKMEIFLATVNWQEVIDALKPYVRVHDFSSFELEKIEYEEKNRCFRFFKKPSNLHSLKKTIIDLERYLYLPSLGFYPKQDDEIFSKEVVEQEEISFFLKQYKQVVETYLKNVSFSAEKKKAQYLLFFDDKADFHIDLYVDQPGDLDRESSAVFLPYVYKREAGFFLLTDFMFEGTKKVIPPTKMGQFVEHFKHWLNQFEGFQIHLNSVESALTYELNEQQTLSFFSRDHQFSGSDLIDLDEWCYLKGFGFFPKTSTRSISAIRSGMKIEKGSIGSFIDQNLTDLEAIQGFFLHKSPVKALGLKVSLNENSMIEIEPKMELFSKEHEGKILVFDGYGYLQKAGFFPLKDGFYLPKGYEEKKVIPLYLEEQFLHFEWNQIQKFIIECDPRLKRIDHAKYVIESVKEDENKRFVLKIFYETANGRIPLGDLIDPVLTNKPYQMTDAGLVFLDEGQFDFLKTFNKRSYSKNSKELKFTFLDWIKIASFIQPEFLSSCDLEAVEKLKSFDAASQAKMDDLPTLTGFQSQLRPYQKIGLKWLWNLYHYDLSGILADDMGLGKTHQAMALLAACLNKPENLQKKYLVVCPTSVIYHWQNLLKVFLPNAKVKMFYGSQRQLVDFEESFDLLLTSYGTLRSDIKEISKVKFEVSILDEMHVAKNQTSQIHKSLKKLTSQMKVGLTGTPIENDLSELKALFDVVLPQYFPDSVTFKEQFVFPIEKYDDYERKKLLKKMIAPFVLRRKKTEVLSDLPEKIEEISYVDLSDEQKALYQQIVQEKRLKMNEMEEEENFYFHVFQLFNKLKQVCNHPALVLQDVANYKNYQSGKFELFKELLIEARNSKQKVVVFSQYLGMLEILRLHLEEEKIGYAGIQGNTRDRKEQIEKFKEDPQCEVFLASLQAAGVGIDLVSASIVIHYDRWWNPAKENQATDRVHRIGQTRGVQVFKLVSKDTIEEHIHDMILKKLELAQSIVGYDEELEMKRIDKEELMHLLQLVHKDF